MKGILHGPIAAACLAAFAPALAAGFDATVGPSATSSERAIGAAFLSVFGSRSADNHIHYQPIGTPGWVDSRNTRKDGLNHEVFLAAGGVRSVSANHHWFVGEQLATTSARTGALSSRFEFMTSVGWQGGRFIMMLRHVSNAQ